MATTTITIKRDHKPAFRPFSREALELALLVGFVPNAFFLLAMPFYIAERMISPLLYLVAGLLSLTAPRWLAYLLFLAAAVIDLGLVVSTAFHLPPETALHSIGYIASINIAASAFYLLAIGLVGGTALATAALTLARRGRLRGASPATATALAGLFMLLDWQANFPYIQSKVDGTPFESAIMKSGLTADHVAARGNNILIVMVEGMGAFAQDGDRAVLTDRLEAVTRRAPFTFARGTSHYFGSTTGAESRELCDRWGDYQDYLAGDSFDCLPRQLAERGYETISYHGFSSSMFSRDAWYPRIGFTRMHFAEEIRARHGAAVTSHCGSVFEGLCDEELGQVVKQELLASSGKPKLVYWLTLNSHLPYVPQERGQLGCTGGKPRIDNRTVCQLSEYWADVMDQVASIAADPDLPPTDILIVGDHHTPLWERAAKNKFVLNRVDWYLLRSTASVRTASGSVR